MIASLGRPFLILFVAVVGLGATARAQAPALDNVDVAVWPEFDQPTALVIYKATLAPTASLPRLVRLTIPSAAGEPHAVACRDEATGQLVLAEYSTTIEGEWRHLDITTTSHRFRVEFYAPIATEDDLRAFQLAWPGTSAVGELTFEVQQPAGSSSLTTIPEAAIRSPGDDGLTYHRGSLGALTEGQSASLSIGYQKTDPRLTREILQASGATAAAPAPAAPAPAAPARSPHAPAAAPMATGGMGTWFYVASALVLLMVLVMVWAAKDR